MSAPLQSLRDRASARKARILFTEHDDERVIAAVSQLQQAGICEPVLLDSIDATVESFNASPDRDDWLQRVLQSFDDSGADAAGFRDDPLQLAAGLLRCGYVDAAISGAVYSTGDVLRTGFKILSAGERRQLVSGLFLMATNDRLLSFSDCAVNPAPDAEQLAQIAIDSAATHLKLTGESPRVAMLSFSTLGSAEHESVERVRTALTIVRQQQPDIDIDGELQFDSAFDAAVAQRKAPDSSVAGRANVFVFPDLNAGNIGYKIAERIGGARAIGPLLQGMSKPWQDLSRGCSAEDIADVAVLTSLLV